MRTDEFNVVLLIAVISWLLAQIIKTIVHLIKTKKFIPERLTGAGGMPSAHSACVCSMAIATCRVCGITSTEFALSMVLALVVMYDAMGVRRSAGLHAREINRLKHIVSELDEEFMDRFDDKVEEIASHDNEESPEKMHELKEFLGHTPLEVLCGALLGILIAMAFPIVVVA